MASEATRRISDFNSQELASMIWAHATVKVSSPKFFQAIADETMKRLLKGDLNVQDMTITIWAFASQNVASEHLFQAVATQAQTRIAEFNPQDLATTAWAFATARCSAPQLFESIATESLRNDKIKDFTSQNLANTAWAFATANVSSQNKFFETIADQTKNRLKDLNGQDIINTIWAFAAVDYRRFDLFEALTSAIVDKMTDLSEAAQSQLYLVALYGQLQQWPSSFPLFRHLDALKAAYLSGNCAPQPSQFQKDISSTLDQIGWAHTFEHETKEGLSLDLAQVDSKLAIEADGPSHYLKDVYTGAYVVNGATVFKSRLLKSFGWTVAHVSFIELHEKHKNERRDILTEKLILFSSNSDDALLDQKPKILHSNHKLPTTVVASQLLVDDDGFQKPQRRRQRKQRKS